MDTAMPGPLGQPKIMIVDDMPDNLCLLHALLTESGYSVRSFPSGPLALRAAARSPPGPDSAGYPHARHGRI